MRKIVASLDVGSSLIKLVVGEIVKNKINILACVDAPSRGIKKGYVINGESAKEAFREVFNKAEEMLGIKITKVISTVPALYAECFLCSGTISVTNSEHIVKNKDIILAMAKAVQNKIVDNRELVTIIPTAFKVNDEVVSDPLNMVTEQLGMKGIAVTVPKKNIEGISATLKSIGVSLVDIGISPLGDYFEFKNKENEKKIGAVVNIGEETTTVSIFNKGILTNSEVIDIGGYAVTNDLSYVYKISNEDALYVKEKMALAHTRLAQPNESVTFTDKHGEIVKINQYDASEVVMGRLSEIINLAKKQINLLTKKEISYIIITGGISEIQDFDILVEEIFGEDGSTPNVMEIGARSNKYATAIGMIKYYDNKLKIKGEEFSMLSLEEQEELSGISKKINVSDNSLLGKLFGYFFDN